MKRWILPIACAGLLTLWCRASESVPSNSASGDKDPSSQIDALEKEAPKLLEPVHINLSQASRKGPFELVTHTGAFYSKKPFILIGKKRPAPNATVLRETVAREFHTAWFEKARVLYAEDYFTRLMGAQPKNRQILRREEAQVLDILYKQGALAIAYRLGACANGTECFAK